VNSFIKSARLDGLKVACEDNDDGIIDDRFLAKLRQGNDADKTFADLVEGAL
jgi:hypothetical protein